MPSQAHLTAVPSADEYPWQIARPTVVAPPPAPPAARKPHNTNRGVPIPLDIANCPWHNGGMTTEQLTPSLREQIWHAAYTAMADYEAVVVTYRGHLGWLASGRYTKRASAFRAQRTIMARDETNCYVVTRGRGDDYVIWLSPEMTL